MAHTQFGPVPPLSHYTLHALAILPALQPFTPDSQLTPPGIGSLIMTLYCGWRACQTASSNAPRTGEKRLLTAGKTGGDLWRLEDVACNGGQRG
jgi:hypothetical protein